MAGGVGSTNCCANARPPQQVNATPSVSKKSLAWSRAAANRAVAIRQVGEPSSVMTCTSVGAGATLLCRANVYLSRARLRRAIIVIYGFAFLSRIDFSPTATRLPCVLKKSVPSEIAGVAMHTSPIGLVASTLNSGPAFTT